MKIHETVDTRAAHFGPDVHEIVCRPASPQTPPLGSLQRSPDPLAALRGLLLRGGEEEGRGGEVRGEGKGGEGRERRGQPPPP